MEFEEIIRKREKQLFDLGFARYALGFTTLGIFISDNDIRISNDNTWNDLFENAKMEVEALRKDADPSQRPPLQKSDKEKMEDFVRSLGQITGPEITDPKILHILDHALVQLKETRAFIKLSLKTM